MAVIGEDIVFIVVPLTSGAESGGGVERGHLPPLTCPIFFFFLYIYIYIFMCVVVKGGDLIEIVINSA